MLNVIDKTQMLPVSANRINHLLQNGKNILIISFHPQQLSYDWTVGSVSVFLAEGLITCCSVGQTEMITEEKFASICF